MAGCQYLFDEYMNERAPYSRIHKVPSHLVREVAAAFGQHPHISV